MTQSGEIGSLPACRLSEIVCTRYGCCKIKTDFVNGVSNFIDRNDLPAQPVLQLYAGHHVTQLVNLLGRVLSRSRNACQFDTGQSVNVCRPFVKWKK